MRRLTHDERIAANLIASWQHNVPKFVWDNFQTELEPWATEVATAYAAPGKRRVMMQAAVGVGKSALEAMLGLHFMATNGDQDKHRGKYPVGYALAINRDTLKSGFWRELGVWYERSPYLQSEFLLTAEQLVHRRHPNWWLRARGYAKNADPETQGAALSGLHGPYTCVILDETGEMHPIMGKRAEQSLSDAECEAGIVLGSGNPTSMSGLLYQVATVLAAKWKVIRVTGDPEDPRRSRRVDIDWARAEIAAHGRENPWVMSHILGLFPPGGLNTLLSPDEVDEAMTNRNPDPEHFRYAQKRLGIDVARFGGDRTALFPRQGLVAYRPVTMRHQRTDAIAARALNIVAQWGSEREYVDDSGHWGHGVVDNLLAARRSVIAVFSEKPDWEPQYFNKRAGNWFRMAEWIKRGGALPNIPEMKPELTQIQYGFKAGKMILEDKKQLKTRIGMSPDLADALALTFSEPDVPSSRSLRRAGHRNAADLVDRYDPHRELV